MLRSGSFFSTAEIAQNLIFDRIDDIVSDRKRPKKLIGDESRVIKKMYSIIGNAIDERIAKIYDDGSLLNFDKIKDSPITLQALISLLTVILC